MIKIHAFSRFLILELQQYGTVMIVSRQHRLLNYQCKYRLLLLSIIIIEFF